jgi:hypothetical protein
MKPEKFININWFMSRRPYAKQSGYDMYYLGICRDLFSIIDVLATEYGMDDLDEDDCREMAYVFTGYFEDQVNNIGFWNSLIALHKKHFGKRLPFFDKDILQQQEEDHDDILPLDIHYLAYITLLNSITEEEEKPIVFFNTDFFKRLTHEVFSYLEDIEEVETTDFYDHFLIPENDYIDFKKQLDWFTFKGYLHSIEFSRKLDDHLNYLVNSGADKSHFSPLLYAEGDRLLCEVPSSFTAFFPLDILAGAMRCDHGKKEEIINLKLRPHGIFQFQRETATHFLLLHTATGEEFNVLKNSLDSFPKFSRYEYLITTLARWNNEYYISGLCTQSPYKDDEVYRKNLELQNRFQKHFQPHREQILETAFEFRQNAAKFFGKDLIVFDTGYQLQEKLNEFNAWYFNNVVEHSKLSDEVGLINFDLPEELLLANGVALFIPPRDNFQFVSKHREFIEILQSDSTDKSAKEKIMGLLPMLSDVSVGVDYWFYLKKHFPMSNLSTVIKCPLVSDEDFEALLRIYQPNEFSPLKLPGFTTFDSKRMNIDGTPLK